MDEEVRYAKQEDTNKLDKFDEKGRRIIDIAPLGKGKRLLVFICDFFIAFFAVFFIFNVMAYPIGKASSGFDEKISDKSSAELAKLDILQDQKMLYYQYEDDKQDFDKCMEWTFNRFLLYWVSSDANLANYDIIHNYYVDIKHDETTYNKTYFESEDEENKYFNYDENNKPISLKNEYKEQFKPFFDDPEKLSEMSDDGKMMLYNFKDKFYTSAYAEVIYDIKANDLKSSTGQSFKANEAIIEAVTHYQNVLIISSTIASYLLVWIILYIVIPLCNKHGKTLAMMMMSIERIGTNNLYLLRKGEVLIASVYHLLTNAVGLMFIPMSVVVFNYIFALTPLFVISVLSFLLVLISIIFMLFNSYNKTLSDLLTQSICITGESLDEIYRERGYKV